MNPSGVISGLPWMHDAGGQGNYISRSWAYSSGNYFAPFPFNETALVTSSY